MFLKRYFVSRANSGIHTFGPNSIARIKNVSKMILYGEELEIPPRKKFATVDSTITGAPCFFAILTPVAKSDAIL